MPDSSVFHPGEVTAQVLAGTQGVADELAPVLSHSLPSGGRIDSLLSGLRLLSVVSVSELRDERHDPYVWVSLVFGSSFVTASSPEHVHIDLAGLAAKDVLRQNLASTVRGCPVGLLAIDFAKRRRYRTNGVVQDLPSPKSGDSGSSLNVLDVSVEEAFPNCPKYIQSRDVTPATTMLPPLSGDGEFESDVRLSTADKALVSSADTFFLGTYYEKRGVDVSHRGGYPGFVRVSSEREIFWPDYRGNGMFQSFGNLQVNNRAGLAFIEFSTGQVLQLTGRAKVEWGIDKALGIESAAERVVRFEIDEVRRSIGPVTNYRWETSGYSPYNPVLMEGREQKLEYRRDGFPMEVSLVKIVEESPVVKTFRFLAPEYISFLPGQYATFDFGVVPDLDTGGANIVRTWTLSEAANSTKGDVTLEVSVKRKPQGIMSNWLHDHAKLGLRAKLLGVGGEMTPFADHPLPKKLLFMSGGIGITPNMAILRGIGARIGTRDQTPPDVVFLHQERLYRDIPFKQELHRRARDSKGRVRLLIMLSCEVADAEEGDRPTHVENISKQFGRITSKVVEEHVKDVKERVIFLCGPTGFMAKMTSELRELGVSEGQIVTEQFNF